MKSLLRTGLSPLVALVFGLAACSSPISLPPAAETAGPLTISLAAPEGFPADFSFDKVDVRLSNGTDSPVIRTLSNGLGSTAVFNNLKPGSWSVQVNAASGKDIFGRSLVYLSGATNLTVGKVSEQAQLSASVPLEQKKLLPLLSSLASGTVAQGTAVALNARTTGADIRYTLNGSEPTETSSLAAATDGTAPSLTLDGLNKVTLKARAFKAGLTASDILTLTFTIMTVDQVVASPSLTQIGTSNQVTVNGPAGAQLYLTTDGTDPTAANLFTATSLTLAEGTTTVKVQARQTGKTDSPIVSATFTYTVAPLPTVAVVSATIAEGATILTTDTISLSTETAGAEIFFTTDNTDPLTSNTKATYQTAVSLPAGKYTLQAIARKTGMKNSPLLTVHFQVNEPTPIGQVAQPTFSPLDSALFTDQPISLTSATTEAVLYYTVDGTAPTTASNRYTAPFPLTVGTIQVKALAVKAGLTDSPVAAKSYTVTVRPLPDQVAAPVFSNPASITVDEGIGLSTSTAGAEIRYTIGTAVPTATSPLYSPAAAFKLTEGVVTVNALALKAGLTPSTVTTKTFTVTKPFSGLAIHVYGYTHVHYWAALPTGSVTPTTWPGLAMTATTGHANWYEFKLPGVTSINFVFSNNGSLQTADQTQILAGERWFKDGKWYAVNPDDNQPPTVKLTSPAAGASLSGTVNLTADASDNTAVARVEFFVGATSIGSVTAAPWTLSWNSALAPSGSNTLKAVAYDGAGNSAADSVIVTTSNANVPPVANAGAPITLVAGGTASFDASASYDPNGTIASYSWDNGLTGVKPTKVYPTVGTYTVTLTVTDNDGATATATVIVNVVTVIAHRDFRDETVYFMMTDRFSDGNKSNNNIWGDEFLPGGDADVYKYDESKTGLLSYYHGGDFDGIINNLDYLKGMGFTAIWITPVVKQPEGRRINNDNNYAASAFHGYWGYDFDQIDPHLTASGKASDGWADFDKLVNALHAKGMKLMLDIVVNHGHPGDSVKGSVSKWANAWNKIIMDGKTWTFDKASDPLVDAANPLTGFYSYPGTGGTWLIDLLDFNGNGPAANSAMPHLKNVYRKFIDHGVDAFRIDTAAYMSHANWKDFTDDMYAHAKAQGNDYFYMVGESWTGDRAGANNAMDIVYGYTNKAEHFNMLDLHNSSMDFPGWLGGVFKGDKGFDDPQVQKIFGSLGDGSGVYDPTYLGTFVDNHDVYRANGILTETQYKNNLNYIYLFRGIPIVYYGTEAMYSWPGAIASTNKEDVCARWMLGDVGINYVKTNQPPMYKHLKMLNSLRATFEVLRKGQQTTIAMAGDKAVVKRVFGTSEAYIALNKGIGSVSQALTGLTDGTYKLLTPNGDGTYTTANVTISGGAYTLNAAANSFAVLVH